MKALAFIKVSLKGLIKELPNFVLSFAIYPIVIALIMGFVQKDMFTPVVNEPIISIIIVDEDNTKESNNLIDFLESEEISQVITVKPSDSEKFQYTLRIPKGYEDSLLGVNTVKVTVEAEEKSSTSMGNLLVNIVDKYNLDRSQGLIVQHNIENNEIELEDRGNLIDEITGILNKAYSTNSINSNIHNVKKSLNSYEYYSISFLNFVIVMFLIAVISSDALEKEMGLYSRIMSTSMTKIQYYNYGLLSSYLMIFTASLIYVGAFRVSGLSFKGSIPILLLIISIQSLMITILGALISTIFKKKYGMPLVQIFLIFQVIFGGMIGPFEKWTNSGVFKFFGKYKPDALIANSYRNYIIYNNLSTVSNYLLIMIIVSIALYLINILAIRLKWGEVK